MARRSVIAWDWDGTVVLHEGMPDFGSSERMREVCRPCPYLAPLVVDGDVVITGRSEDLEAVTREQLQELEARHVELHMQAQWNGYREMATWKGARLQQLQREYHVELYVGDHPADLAAAKIADVEFVWADQLRRELQELDAALEAEVVPDAE